MKRVIIALQLFLLVLQIPSFSAEKEATYSLTVEVKDLRNSNGVVQFALYNKDGSLPDEEFKKCIKILKAEIKNASATVTFTNLPAGRYAVNILHDEDNNGKIKKGFVMPIEGIGFSNYQAIGPANRPAFPKASFELNKNLKINVKVIYM